MCGIAGIVSFSQETVDEHRIRTMMQVIKHRGPNDEGVFIRDNVGFGHVRLSILDLTETGHQPMKDETGRYTIILNGEVFNYIELREELKTAGVVFVSDSDTEVLLKGYIHYGRGVLDKLNGMFAFAIYDAQEKEVFAARDRFGVKPFYYYLSDQEFIFASEIPAILAVYGQQNQANEKAIFDYLAFNRTDQTEDTFFEGIKKLQHGHFITIQNNKASIVKWYDLREKVLGRHASSDVSQFKELIEDSVKLRLRSEVPVGVCLSGGLDSSTIVSIVSDVFGRKDVHTFSSIYQQKHRADESEYINLFNDKLANMHFAYPTEASLMDDLRCFIMGHAEPVPSTGPYAQFCTMREASKYVTVTLDGQGADEELAGYHYFYGLYYKSLLKRGRIVRLMYEIIKYTSLHHSTYALKSFFFFLLPARMRSKARVLERGYLTSNFANKYSQSVISDNLYGAKSLQDALISHFEYKLEHLLKWEDRNSMQFSLEARTPFLDYRLVEYLLSTEDEAKIKGGYTKILLREATKGLIPEKIRLRADKVGYATPESIWFKSESWRCEIEKLLDSESFKSRGIIDSEKAKRLFGDFCSGRNNISKDIWKWINLELWYRTFIDGKQS